jgi:hypothetical protein
MVNGRLTPGRPHRLVMPGLDPGIHAERQRTMDCRVKPGNDEFSAIFGNDAFHNECVARAQLRMVPSAVRTRARVIGY